MRTNGHATGNLLTRESLREIVDDLLLTRCQVKTRSYFFQGHGIHHPPLQHEDVGTPCGSFSQQLDGKRMTEISSHAGAELRDYKRTVKRKVLLEMGTNSLSGQGLRLGYLWISHWEGKNLQSFAIGGHNVECRIH